MVRGFSYICSVVHQTSKKSVFNNWAWQAFSCGKASIPMPAEKNGKPQ